MNPVALGVKFVAILQGAHADYIIPLPQTLVAVQIAE